MTDMISGDLHQNLYQPRRKARATQSVPDADRRAFLKVAMAQGIAAPVALAALQCPAIAQEAPIARPAGLPPRKGAMRHSVGDRAELHAAGAIVRDFADPQLELLRLLREAAEIEHALMLQYLFAAFSLREDYHELAGHGAVTSDNLLGVAIQEMQHLSAVNQLLVALGSCPHLDRQDFPYEPDIYPFAFQLESMSRASLAKFVFCEAPSDMFDLSVTKSPKDEAFRQRVIAQFGGRGRPNHIGSLYRSVLDMLEEVSKQPDAPITLEAAAEWRATLEDIMEEGEDDHFKFFRSAFEASHDAFKVATVEDVWGLPATDAAFPSYPLAPNPTAFIGHPNQLESAPALVLAWLGNLHYWTTLSTLDYGYRTNDSEAISLATMQMMMNIWPIATQMPSLGSGLPFDPLSMGYALGSNPDHSKRLIKCFARETQEFARSIEHRLPSDYDPDATSELITYLSA
ncbi:MAG: ferritin-like domain-containing protein [Pseudorhodobacter sp.]